MYRFRQKALVGNTLPNFFYPEAGGHTKAAYSNTKKPGNPRCRAFLHRIYTDSYTHFRPHGTASYFVCRLLLEK
ncbi:MAG: hypothetical protein KAX50_07810, partial [Saprospiraceae bacterium]|nr:hypothetical protein [Saprospiraceae bacterium]